jgi:hypothetical protein
MLSIGILTASLVMQSHSGKPIDLPSRWILLSLSPVLIALIVRGYITKFKAAGVDIAVDFSKKVVYVGSPDERRELGGAARDRDATADTWTNAYDGEHKRAGELFLVHTCKPSDHKGQKYDATIFLMKHVPGTEPNKTVGFDDIERAEFYLGPHWNGGTKIFIATNTGGPIGITVSAWGMFLVTCRVIFKPGREPEGGNKEPILHRYVDFELANQLAEVIKWLPDKEERALISVLKQWRRKPGPAALEISSETSTEP